MFAALAEGNFDLLGYGLSVSSNCHSLKRNQLNMRKERNTLGDCSRTPIPRSWIPFIGPRDPVWQLNFRGVIPSSRFSSLILDLFVFFQRAGSCTFITIPEVRGQ